jgi:ABC-type lipoprotein release transport system permease subunit
MRSLQNGGYAQMIDDAVAPLTGHIQVHEKGFQENMTLEYAFKYDSSMLDEIKRIKAVKEAAPRIYAGGLLIYKDSSAGAEILAMRPELERNIINLHNYILPGGRFLEKGDSRSIILGKNLADNLGIKTGETVSIVSQGFDGSIAADSFEVKGIFRSPNVSYNRTLALIPFVRGNETFSMSGYISSIVIRADDIDSVPIVTRKVEEIVGEDLEVMPWDKLMPEILQFIVMDRASSHIFVFILYMIVAFGILNTIQMSVFERIRELGIMLSIGTSPARIFSMIITESAIISVIGIILGLLSGAALSCYFTVYPMDFSEYQAEMELYGMSTLVYYAKLKASDFYYTGLMVFLLSLAFTFFPARRAAKLNPVRAIRHL